MITFSFPAGEYFIGDPWFIFKDNKELLFQYSDFLKTQEKVIEKECKAVFHPALITLHLHYTLEGNGYFPDNFSNNIGPNFYAVESGLIAIISIINVKMLNPSFPLTSTKLYQVFKFPNDFEVCFNERDPSHQFGYIKINTLFDEQTENYFNNDEG